MKKKVFVCLLACLTLLMVLTLTACNACLHSYGDWVVDREATESEAGERHRECTKCGNRQTESIPQLTHTHTYADTWSYDESYHWHAATCGHANEVSEKAEHTFAEGGDTCTVCGVKTTPVAVNVYIDGQLTDTIYTSAVRGYKITPPEKPQDRTGENGKELHFYGWYTDSNFQTPLLEDTKFIGGGSIYGKWMEISAEDFTYKVSEGEATITGLSNPQSDATTLVIPSYINGFPVTKIGERAFQDNTFFRTLIFREGVQVIEYQAFSGCNSLTQIEFPSTLTTIKSNAFYGCTILPSVFFPAFVKEISYNAFSGCKKLESLTVDSKNTVYHSDGNCVIETESKTLVFGCKNSEIPSDGSVTSIGVVAFGYCAGLTKIAIPSYITSIESSAFAGCTALTGVYITDLAKWCEINHANAEANPLSFAHNLYLDNTLITELVIPGTVTKIGSYAFFGYTELTKITIPNSVTSIGQSAFSGCTGFTNVVVPNSVTSIGQSAFFGCSNIESITLPFVGAEKDGEENGSLSYIFGSSYDAAPLKLKSVVVTGGTKIGSFAFSGYTGLTDIRIPDNVISIGVSAFRDCKGLTNLVIPNTVKTIGENAFSGCTGFKNLVIPNSVTSIGNAAFGGCTNLESITLPFIGAEKGGTANTDFGYIFGYNLYSYGSYKSYNIPSGLKTVSITGGESIGNAAFYECGTITSIRISDSIKTIGSTAFAKCSGLSDIVIPSSVESIGSAAFAGCTALTGVYISDMTKWIDIKFEDFSSNPLSSAHKLYLKGNLVTSVVIPSGVTNIGDYAFAGCTEITSVNVSNGVSSIGKDAFFNCTGVTKLSLSNSVKDIGNNAFSGCTGITNLTLPNSVTNIGNSAFSGCAGIANLTLPDSVTNIGDAAFSGCTGITSLTLSNNITNIGVSAFSECTGLTNVVVPDSTEYIGRAAFYGCINLKSITLPFVGGSKDGTENTDFGYIFGASSYSSNEDYVPKSLKTVVITGCESIGNAAFQNCSGITQISIPNSITKIGARAFSGCTSLVNIEIPNGVTRIGDSAFWGCTKLASIKIPNSVTSIGANAFGSVAYNRCAALEGVYITDVAKWCAIDFGNESANPLNCANRLYLNGTLITNLEIPEGVASIGKYAFFKCTELTSITLPSSIAGIGDSAFAESYKLIEVINYSSLNITVRSRDCGYIGYYAEHIINNAKDTYLSTDDSGYIFYDNGRNAYLLGYRGSDTELVLPETTPKGKKYEIYQYAFYTCSGLASVTIPSGVTSIGKCAFYNCLRLTSVVIPESVKNIGDSAFFGCYKLIEIINRSTLNIVAGNEKHGYVSYYAKHIIADIKYTYLTVDKNGYIFYDDGSNVYLMGYTGSDVKLVLPETSPAGKKYRIYNYAFSGCSWVTDITIPKSITSIGEKVFSGCRALKNMYYKGTQEEWQAIFKSSDWDQGNYGYEIHYDA